MRGKEVAVLHSLMMSHKSWEADMQDTVGRGSRKFDKRQVDIPRGVIKSCDPKML